jgi:Spy/CpxP family protein refolding chaperone
VKAREGRQHIVGRGDTAGFPGALGILCVLCFLCVLCVTAPASAQGGGRQAQRPNPPTDESPAVTPAEIQRMFDSYALMQAQEQLQIRDDQFPRFLTRFKALQDIRRQALQQRARRIAELRRLLQAAEPDETAIREQMKGLAEINERTEADSRKAYEAIDEVLTVPQQAKFRIFEEMMERRKLELVSRARQANRAKR